MSSDEFRRKLQPAVVFLVVVFTATVITQHNLRSSSHTRGASRPQHPPDVREPGRAGKPVPTASLSSTSVQLPQPKAEALESPNVHAPQRRAAPQLQGGQRLTWTQVPASDFGYTFKEYDTSGKVCPFYHDMVDCNPTDANKMRSDFQTVWVKAPAGSLVPVPTAEWVSKSLQGRTLLMIGDSNVRQINAVDRLYRIPCGCTTVLL